MKLFLLSLLAGFALATNTTSTTAGSSSSATTTGSSSSATTTGSSSSATTTGSSSATTTGSSSSATTTGSSSSATTTTGSSSSATTTTGSSSSATTTTGSSSADTNTTTTTPGATPVTTTASLEMSLILPTGETAFCTSSIKTPTENTIKGVYEDATSATATVDSGCRRMRALAEKRRLTTVTNSFTVTQTYADSTAANNGITAIGNTLADAAAFQSAFDIKAANLGHSINATVTTYAAPTITTTSTTSSAAKAAVSMVFAAVAFVGLAA